jgi:glycosyltransferase 2 family protein
MSEEQSLNPWRRRLYYVGMALGLVLFLWQLVSAIVTLRQREVPLVAPGWLAAALGLVVAGYLLQLGAWLLVMRFLRNGLTFNNSFAGYYLSFLPRYIPGTVWGYLGRSEWLSRRHGITYRRSSIGSLLEAGSFVATALLIGALVYLVAPWQLLSAAMLVVAGISAWPLLARAAKVAVSGSQWLLIPAAYLAYFCYWLLQGLSLGAICRALGVGQGVDLLHLVAASAVGWSAGFLILFVPAGFGVRELSLTYLLTTQSGMAPADANLVAVLSRASMIVAELLMLATAMVWRNRAATQPVTGP